MNRITCMCVALAISCLAVSCASNTASAGIMRATGGSQPDAEVQRMMADLKPTERMVPAADSRLLWQATQGYMDRAFPLDELPVAVTEGTGGSRQLRSKLVQWVGDGLPHRTRVFVEIRPDPANVSTMRLRAIALMIEPEPQLEQARPGVPLEYNWRLVGSNPRVEETVLDQIMRRYLALVEGKPLPLDDELIIPRPAGS